MSQESGVVARVEGRTKVAERTAWELDVAGFRLRCLKEPGSGYVVQARGERGWTEKVTRKDDPAGKARRVRCGNAGALVDAPIGIGVRCPKHGYRVDRIVRLPKNG